MVYATYLSLNSISFKTLIRCYIYSHIPVIIYHASLFEVQWKVDFKRLKEFVRLCIYGISTSLISGIDRLILVDAGYSYQELAIYAYALAFSALPSFAIEAVKQFISPSIYHDLTKKGVYSKSTSKKLALFITILVTLQFILPYLAIQIAEYLGMYNSILIPANGINSLVMLFNFGFALHICYHFLNPYLFYYDRTRILLAVQIIGIIIFYAGVGALDEVNNNVIISLRVIMFFIVTSSTAFLTLNGKLLKNMYTEAYKYYKMIYADKPTMHRASGIYYGLILLYVTLSLIVFPFSVLIYINYLCRRRKNDLILEVISGFTHYKISNILNIKRKL